MLDHCSSTNVATPQNAVNDAQDDTFTNIHHRFTNTNVESSEIDLIGHLGSAPENRLFIFNSADGRSPVEGSSSGSDGESNSPFLLANDELVDREKLRGADCNFSEAFVQSVLPLSVQTVDNCSSGQNGTPSLDFIGSCHSETDSGTRCAKLALQIDIPLCNHERHLSEISPPEHLNLLDVLSHADGTGEPTLSYTCLDDGKGNKPCDSAPLLFNGGAEGAPNIFEDRQPTLGVHSAGSPLPATVFPISDVPEQHFSSFTVERNTIDTNQVAIGITSHVTASESCTIAQVFSKPTSDRKDEECKSTDVLGEEVRTSIETTIHKDHLPLCVHSKEDLGLDLQGLSHAWNIEQSSHLQNADTVALDVKSPSADLGPSLSQCRDFFGHDRNSNGSELFPFIHHDDGRTSQPSNDNGSENESRGKSRLEDDCCETRDEALTNNLSGEEDEKCEDCVTPDRVPTNEQWLDGSAAEDENVVTTILSNIATFEGVTPQILSPLAIQSPELSEPTFRSTITGLGSIDRELCFEFEDEETVSSLYSESEVVELLRLEDKTWGDFGEAVDDKEFSDAEMFAEAVEVSEMDQCERTYNTNFYENSQEIFAEGTLGIDEHGRRESDGDACFIDNFAQTGSAKILNSRHDAQGSLIQSWEISEARSCDLSNDEDNSTMMADNCIFVSDIQFHMERDNLGTIEHESCAYGYEGNEEIARRGSETKCFVDAFENDEITHRLGSDGELNECEAVGDMKTASTKEKIYLENTWETQEKGANHFEQVIVTSLAIDIEGGDENSSSSDLSPEAFQLVRKQKSPSIIESCDVDMIEPVSLYGGGQCESKFQMSDGGEDLTIGGNSHSAFQSDVITKTVEMKPDLNEIPKGNTLLKVESVLYPRKIGRVSDPSTDQTQIFELMKEMTQLVKEGEAACRQLRADVASKKYVTVTRDGGAKGFTKVLFGMGKIFIYISCFLLTAVALFVVSGCSELTRIDGTRFSAARV